MLQRKVVGWNGATDLKGNSKIFLAPRCKCPYVMHTKPKALFSCFPPVSICTFGQMMVQTGELLAADRNRALTGVVGRPTDGSKVAKRWFKSHDSLPAQLHGPQGWHMSNDCHRNLSQSNLIHITVLVLIRQPRSRPPLKAIDPVDFSSSGIHRRVTFS